MIRVKRSRVGGSLNEMNCGQRREAKTCYFQGRAALRYRMLKVLPVSGCREVEPKDKAVVVTEVCCPLRGPSSGYQIHSERWSKTGQSH